MVGQIVVQSERSKSLTEVVYDRLKDDILRTRRKPSEIIIEADLADIYGVSKTPVREALRLLAQDGWVIVMPRKGYLVRPLRLNDIRDTFAIRVLLEPMFAADAARVITPKQYSDLERLAEEQNDVQSELDLALVYAQKFHLAVVGIVGNSRIEPILSSLLDEVRRLHYMMPNIEGHITSRAEIEAHQRLLVALRSHDADLARKVMADHLNEVTTTLVSTFTGMRRELLCVRERPDPLSCCTFIFDEHLC
jgi:GntR family transcriptional regulator, rspAB operon transcriptional repressor